MGAASWGDDRWEMGEYYPPMLPKGRAPPVFIKRIPHLFQGLIYIDFPQR